MHAGMHLPNDVCPGACAASSTASISLRCGLFPDGLHFWTRDTLKTPLFYLLRLKAPCTLASSFFPPTYSRTSSWLSEKSAERFRISRFSDSVAHNGYVLSSRYDCTHFSVSSHLFCLTYSCMKYDLISYY